MANSIYEILQESQRMNETIRNIKFNDHPKTGDDALELLELAIKSVDQVILYASHLHFNSKEKMTLKKGRDYIRTASTAFANRTYGEDEENADSLGQSTMRIERI